MDPQPMAFVATGQADLFTHYVKPKVAGDDFALNFTEMTSPVQLLFGSFDLAFVIIYLLPLIIIAFSYNVLSAEKEQGTLRLLAAQPIGIPQWVLQKLGLRFFWLSVVVLSCLLVAFLAVGFNPFSQAGPFLLLAGLILVYMLFWFALAFLVNIRVGSSARNAVALLGLWVGFVLLIPSVLNQLGSTLYPIPSRTLMINEMRGLKAEMTDKQDEILDNFLRDHPEYALNDTAQSRGFYHRYMASQRLVEEELAPLVDAYEDQLQLQQRWIGRFNWVSPAVTIQESLNRLAGNATDDYMRYRAQVVAFAGSWRDHLMPFLYNNRDFTTEDYADLPRFEYVPGRSSSNAAVLSVLGISIALIIGGVVSYRRGSQKDTVLG
jgi:ABC-2 type transport system permease protein